MVEPIYILLLDDDPTYVAPMLSAFETGDGTFQAAVATSLTAARALLETRLPDLIITEWALPDGCALDLLPAANAFPRLSIIVLTNNSNLRSAVAAIKAGALDYLVKSEIVPADLPQIARRAMYDRERLIDQLPARAHQRAQAEEALRESEQRFRTLICDVHVGVILQGQHAEILHCNQAALDLLGLSVYP